MRRPLRLLLSLRLSRRAVHAQGQRVPVAELGGVEVQAKMFNPRPVAPGETLNFRLTVDKCHLFDTDSGKAIRG